MNVHTVTPTSPNTTYGTSPVLTSVTPENATVIATRIPRGCRSNQIGPRADCLYLILMSRAPTTRATGSEVAISDTDTRRLVGTASRTGNPALAVATVSPGCAPP